MPQKTNTKSFNRILQSPVDIDAKKWIFTVPNVPQCSAPLQRDGSISIKFITFSRRVRQVQPGVEETSLREQVSSPEHDAMKMRMERAEPCRVFSNKNMGDFLLVSFADFRIENRATEKFMILFLETGITLNGKHYNFYGHSNSQLKSRTCYMYAADKQRISEDIKNMGDFSSISNVAKLSKRIGLMFSSATTIMQLDAARTLDIPDIRISNYIFTDGCGLIAPSLAKVLARRARIVFRNTRYTPSVFQIRYRGYKGVLTVDHKMELGVDKAILVKFRESMKKFKGGLDLSFSVIGFSKPYSFGRLNDEILLLIRSLGISSEILRRKQKEYFEMMSEALTNHETCFRFLHYRNEVALAEELLMDGIESVREQVQAQINREHSAHINHRNEQRCRILILKSRLLYGICDPYGVLKEGQCAVRITTFSEDGGEIKGLANAEVLVTRNPCLHPGDCQKFMAVHHPDFANLSDCIIFPTKGKRPIADMLSGGDLDGDKFFVTWDKDIIPRVMSIPAVYIAPRERVQFGKMDDKERIEYFANYNNAALGRAKKLYLEWARVKGADCSECVQLNYLYSQSVDGAKIRIPEHLTNTPSTKSPHDQGHQKNVKGEGFILDVLHSDALAYIHNFQNSRQLKRSVVFNGYGISDIEHLLLSLDEQSLACSQTELVHLILKWCHATGYQLGNFINYFDFSSIPHEEKLLLLDHIPPTMQAHSLIFNGLLQSNIVDINQLRRFKLHYPGFHWKKIFRAGDVQLAGQDRLGALMDNLRYAMERFHRKFIFLKVDERLSVGIYIPSIIECHGTENVIQDRVRLFAFTAVRDEHGVNPVAVRSKFNTKLIVEANLFQLFEGVRGNTFIFMQRSQRPPLPGVVGREAVRKAREKETRQGIASDWVISIALNKFNNPLQQYMGRVNRQGVKAAEIYVISNLDHGGMRLLDLWLDQVDSDPDAKIRNFEDEQLKYSIPMLKDINWNQYENGDILESLLINNHELALGQVLVNETALEDAFNILLTCQEYTTLSLMISRLVTTTVGDISSRCLGLLSNLFDQRPTLFISLVRFLDEGDFRCSGDNSGAVEAVLSLWRRMLKWAIFSMREAGEFVVEPFRKVLLRYKQLSFDEFTDIVETLVLSSDDTEVAITILYMLDEYSTRILVGRPTAVAYFVRNLIGVALDYLGEVDESVKVSRPNRRKLTVRLKSTQKANQFQGSIRVDQLYVPRVGDHIRLVEAIEPESFGNRPRWMWKPAVRDALVLSFQSGKMLIRMIQAAPWYTEACEWSVQTCGSFVTTKTLMDALSAFSSGQENCSGVYENILEYECSKRVDQISWDTNIDNRANFHDVLNSSQNYAVKTALKHEMTLIWGPPGTGKTTTIAVLLSHLSLEFPRTRILVSAPTHNAVDNILERCITLFPELSKKVIRVSTDVRKVSSKLRNFTCDAFVGKDLTEDNKGRKMALQRVKDSRLIFTTCVGAGIGLLRGVDVGVVVVDEASQQTEPTSLVPLVKLTESPGKAILVGDHVQLRATVTSPVAVAHGYSVSMFERLFRIRNTFVQKKLQTCCVMLDTQYRMHPDLCNFSSNEFYEGRLKTGIELEDRELPKSAFPWPRVVTAGETEEVRRMVFVECDAPEDLGRKSKSNCAQAEVCKRICDLLLTASQIEAGSIAILSPYTRQINTLNSTIPGVLSSTIDSFQGKEADFIIFSTVRSNEHGSLGFLTDHRRLNVVLTRARLGMIIVGNQRTLRGHTNNPGKLGRATDLNDDLQNSVEIEGHGLWKRLLDSIPKIILGVIS